MADASLSCPRPRRWGGPSLVFALALVTAVAGPAFVPEVAVAQTEEARALFERGNRHLAAGMRARGSRRTSELERALEAYRACLQIVRSRNVVFNTALALEGLGRLDEAYGYFVEYLGIEDLSDEEREEGEARRRALAETVAVIRVESDPPGADVRIDRRDLPPRGQTPLEIAVPPGNRRVLLSREGYEPSESEVEARVGASASVELALVPRPISVQVIAPTSGRLTLDGQPIVAGRTLAVPPGEHVVRLEMAGSPPVERSFEIAPGAAPLVLELSAAEVSSAPRLAVRVNVPAELFVDGARVGRGRQMEVPTRPGVRRVRIEARGRSPITQDITLAAGGRTALDVSLGAGPDTSGLIVARVLGLILSVGGLATAGALTGILADRHGQWERDVQLHNMNPNVASQRELSDEAAAINSLGVATDIVWAVTGVIGALTLVTLFLDPGEGEPSSIDISFAPSLGGGQLVARMPWGTP